VYSPSFQTQGARWFVIFAGGVLGVSAALLWSAQGSIMMSYPLEKDKGKAFGVFWAIFQFGSFIGSDHRSGYQHPLWKAQQRVNRDVPGPFSRRYYFLRVLIPCLGIHNHYVYWHGINIAYPTS
jgi:hypothetical protein